jgi:hypothetical protein
MGAMSASQSIIAEAPRTHYARMIIKRLKALLNLQKIRHGNRSHYAHNFLSHRDGR